MLFCKKHFFFLFILICVSRFSFSQQKARVEILQSDRFEYSKESGDLRRLLGNVILSHNGALMYCDSAYQYVESNTVQAFGHIKINRGDTLKLYGETLDYNGNTRAGTIRTRVKLIDNGMTLTTDFIDFNFATNISSYFNGGKIIDSVNTLTSRLGSYYSDRKEFFFREKVILKNKDYTIYSDTLRYNTQSHIAYFMGFTKIFSDSNRIYCNKGWYNTETDVAQINDNAQIDRGANTLKGDQIYYERSTGIGIANGNVYLNDTTRKLTLQGNYARWFEKEEKGWVSDEALLIQASDGDTLFLHADTLKLDPAPDAKYKEIRAFNHVRFFRADIQGKCDSLFYSQADSTFRFRGNPVLWAEEYQLSSNQTDLFTSNRKADRIVLTGASFVISELDSGLFNQISGKNLEGFFADNQLRRIEVTGNGETIYYPEDKTEKIGHNKVICSDISINLKEGKPHRIKFLTEPNAVLTPMSKVQKEEQFLKGFNWLKNIRPMNRYDIFQWK